ncbi:MAG TPA: multicopper oxidase domain-containing protein [Gemmatimonadaceae bacterium]|nr:multicopper oxidase domain-containing protein [Gemmatimonadaceae bacterium]
MWYRARAAVMPRSLLVAATAAVLSCSPDRITAPPPESAAPDPAQSASLRTRTYYIAADLVEWNYAPSGRNQITGEPFGDAEAIFVNPGPGIGLRYKKALYREYTDESFSTLKPRPDEWQHLGMLGPVVRAQVGDTLRIVFRNNADRVYSFHPHGLFYRKDSEGAPYDDGTSGPEKADDLVPPGGTHVYILPVPERAGPGPQDGSSVLWMYHSHVDEPKDANTGLMGPIIVTARGRAREDGRPNDVDREFVTQFMVVDENKSWYLEDNIASTPEAEPGAQAEFEEANLKHAINGYIFGNLPVEQLTMPVGERVRWYVFGMGTEIDLHTPHWHGQTLLWQGTRVDVIELLPATLRVLDMVPDSPGIWLYHCHVDDHITAGMMARFNVLP